MKVKIIINIFFLLLLGCKEQGLEFKNRETQSGTIYPAMVPTNLFKTVSPGQIFTLDFKFGNPPYKISTYYELSFLKAKEEIVNTQIPTIQAPNKADLYRIRIEDAIGSVIWFDINVGLGSSGFSAVNSTSFDNGSRASDVYTGDFNGDGHLDIIAANNSSPSIRLYSGAGDGTFNFEQSLSSPTIMKLSVVDLEADGDLDIVYTNRVASNQVCRYLNDGAGNFSSLSCFDLPTPNTGTVNAYYIKPIFLNNDKYIDFVVTANSSGKEIYPVLSESDGALSISKYEISNIDDAYKNLSVGDYNSDGLLDIVLHSSTRYIALSDGQGSFSDSFNVGFASGPGGGDSCMKDINHDGYNDLIQHHWYYGLTASINNLDQTLTQTYQLLGGNFVHNRPSLYSLVCADLNGDNNVDMIAPMRNRDFQSGGGDRHAAWYLTGNDDGSFNSPSRVYSSHVHDNAYFAGVGHIADINSDGKLDIVMGSLQHGQISLLPAD